MYFMCFVGIFDRNLYSFRNNNYTMQVTDIDKKVDEAIYYLEMAIDRIERDADNYELYPCKIGLNVTPANYEKSAYQINKIIENLKIFKNVHRLYKINDSMKVSIFSALLNNEDPTPIIITSKYTVTDEDTLEGIGQKFNMDWKTIADYNDIDSMSLTAGSEIEIPREVDPKLILNYTKTKNPVFDLPQGENVLGKDLPNRLEASSTGDLESLDHRATFVQGINNIIETDEGALPFNPNFGLDRFVGDDVPRDLTTEWIKQKVQNAFLKDERVFEVPNDEIEVERSGESVTITANIYPVEGLSFETLIAETNFQ